jgi:hypothetical protein
MQIAKVQQMLDVIAETSPLFSQLKLLVNDADHTTDPHILTYIYSMIIGVIATMQNKEQSKQQALLRQQQELVTKIANLDDDNLDELEAMIDNIA